MKHDGLRLESCVSSPPEMTLNSAFQPCGLGLGRHCLYKLLASGSIAGMTPTPRTDTDIIVKVLPSVTTRPAYCGITK
jgi:hypothetical protein